MNLKILNSRERRKLAEELVRDYGVKDDVLKGYEVLSDGPDIWLTSRRCLECDLTGFNLDSLGLQLIRDGKPTINGAQLILKEASTELTEEEAREFIGGKKKATGGQLVSYRGHTLGLV